MNVRSPPPGGWVHSQDWGPRWPRPRPRPREGGGPRAAEPPPLHWRSPEQAGPALQKPCSHRHSEQRGPRTLARGCCQPPGLWVPVSTLCPWADNSLGHGECPGARGFQGPRPALRVPLVPSPRPRTPLPGGEALLAPRQSPANTAPEPEPRRPTPLHPRAPGAAGGGPVRLGLGVPQPCASEPTLGSHPKQGS